MRDNTIGRRRLLALAGFGLAGAALAACSKPTAAWNNGAAGPSGVPSDSSSPSPTATPKPTGAPVHVRLYQGDGSTWGVGMPIIAYLSAKITDSKSFNDATKVTVNGQQVQGAWFFMNSTIYQGYPLEAHYRLQDYWPGHAQIHMDLPVQGLSAGPNLVFDDSLTLDMNTGPKNITAVDGKAERMIVTSDDKQVFSFPVSLGKATTPTYNGIKVVIDKKNPERMIGHDPGDQYNVLVPWSCRLTNSGEYIHAASWNGGNIGQRSTSNGCTNLNVNDAQNYYNFAQLGDVATYVNTGGGTMPSWDGYGDWNLPWTTWQGGGIVQPKS
jgi:lipoprotein-anchoring transpeptidase ErfK/SrfK